MLEDYDRIDKVLFYGRIGIAVVTLLGMVIWYTLYLFGKVS